MTEVPNSKTSAFDQVQTRGAVWFALALFVFIVTISALADLGEPSVLFEAIHATPHADKICHFAFFGAFAFFAHRALGFREWRWSWGVVPVGPLVVLAFATLEELSQAYFPNRTLDLVDWLADLSGVAVFTWAAQLRRKRV